MGLAVEDRIRRGLAKAKQASESSDYPQHRLGCALYYGKSVLGLGWNSSIQTHPTQEKFNKYRHMKGKVWTPKVHAEIKALESSRHYEVNWKKVTLYVWREHRNGIAALARPCPACMQAIRQLGIRHIIYSDENDLGYSIESVV